MATVKKKSRSGMARKGTAERLNAKQDKLTKALEKETKKLKKEMGKERKLAKKVSEQEKTRRAEAKKIRSKNQSANMKAKYNQAQVNAKTAKEMKSLKKVAGRAGIGGAVAMIAADASKKAYKAGKTAMRPMNEKMADKDLQAKYAKLNRANTKPSPALSTANDTKIARNRIISDEFKAKIAATRRKAIADAKKKGTTKAAPKSKTVTKTVKKKRKVTMADVKKAGGRLAYAASSGPDNSKDSRKKNKVKKPTK